MRKLMIIFLLLAIAVSGYTRGPGNRTVPDGSFSVFETKGDQIHENSADKTQDRDRDQDKQKDKDGEAEAQSSDDAIQDRDRTQTKDQLKDGSCKE